MPIVFLGRNNASGRAFDSDVLAWEAAVIANGGTVSLARRILVDQLVFGLKGAGYWDLTDDCWLLAVGNATQALTSLKQRRLATATNSPTFTADQGYTFDGSTNYIDTGFIASTHATIAGQQSAHICAYSRTNLSSGFDAGASSSGSRNWTIRVRTGANATASFNSVTTATIASPSALGLHCATRTGDTFEMYRNGASLGTYVPSSFITATLVASSLWIGALNSSGTFSTGSARQTAFVGVGASLTAAQNLALYNAVQSYMTAIGANV